MIRVIEVSKCVEFGELYDGGILSIGQGPLHWSRTSFCLLRAFLNRLSNDTSPSFEGY